MQYSISGLFALFLFKLTYVVVNQAWVSRLHFDMHNTCVLSREMRLLLEVHVHLLQPSCDLAIW